MRYYKIICFLILILNYPNVFSQNSNEDLKITTVEFDFSGEDCIRRSRDICSSKITNDFSEKLKMVSLKSNSRSFNLFLKAKNINESDQISIIGKSFKSFNKSETKYFVQGYDYVLENNILNALGLDSQYNTIKKGTYPIQKNDDGVYINFTLDKE